ncbi:MAG: UDP-N-acetylglucosamine--N-acetylmuramyl-(pentapeptide) pyrophosphoryl-undecaprenol N-acetylglucosamine transferase, partial [Elusimicrobiaceae bacterium]|nr:UDP-N-acetylglucosamine--N-acetylmuramyl-(pentapeptide) pyrophosphoryl-undecaprenol N-acetylglucosamine transferase [Elusimicrobiaceae bacterium]
KTYKNSVLTSTPIREQFAQEVSREEVLTGLGLNSQGAVALIMGGSQGAKGLNEALPGMIKQFPQWQFIHLTGRNWYEKQQALYQGLPNVKTLAYSEEVYKLMKAADCMICRSGASTLAEVIACKIPAILVPFPYAAANHQYVNAQVLADAGCAQLVPEGKQFAQRLAQALSELSPQRLTQMRGAYEKLTIPSALSATNTISHLLENL